MESVSPVDSTYLHTLHGCSHIYIYIYIYRILLYLANYVLVATRLSNGPLPVVARFQRWGQSANCSSKISSGWGFPLACRSCDRRTKFILQFALRFD